MTSKRYAEEFKVEAVRQITERGRPVGDVAKALGVSQYSLYQWLKRLKATEPERQAKTEQDAEVRRLKSELRQVSEERDILKKAAAYFAKVSG